MGYNIIKRRFEKKERKKMEMQPLTAKQTSSIGRQSGKHKDGTKPVPNSPTRPPLFSLVPFFPKIN